jgi:hypothetical protein
MTDARSSRKLDLILFAVLAAVVVAFAGFWIADPSRTVGETTGTILALTIQPSTGGHAGADRTAMIRLADGTLVQARVVAESNLRSGQRAKLLVSEQLLSGTRTYEVLESAEDVK